MRFRGLMPGLARSNTPRRHRRATPGLTLEGLEERLVLSHTAIAPAHVTALVQSRSNTSIKVPITLTNITINSLVAGANGSLNLSGSVSGTILGQTFTGTVSGTITQGHGNKAVPTLRLDIQPVTLNTLGLNLATSPISITLTGNRGAGVQGSALRTQLNGILSAANSGSSVTATANLNTLLGQNVMTDINLALSAEKAKLLSFNGATNVSGPTIGLSLGTSRINPQGLSVSVTSGLKGSVTVGITGTASGGQFGTLLGTLTGGLHGNALRNEIGAVLRQITNLAITLPGGGTTTPSQLVKLDIKPLDLNLLGLEVKTSEIMVTVSTQPGSGELLGNLLNTLSGLTNLTGVSNALNNVLANVTTLANAASLNVNGVVPGGSLTTSTSTADVPVLNAHIAPVHLNLLGAVVDTSPIDLTIIAHPGNGNVLGNVVADLANALNTQPTNGPLDIPALTSQIQTLNNELAATLPNIPAANSPPHTVPTGTTNVLSLNVAPINLNLLGLVLHTDQIQVNADAESGDGKLLGNLLTGVLNSVNGTPSNLTDLNNQVNDLLAKVVGVLNASTLTLAPNAVSNLSPTLKTLTLPNLVNTSGTSASSPILDLNVASSTSTPPVDVDLLGLVVSTSDIHATLTAQTGNGQVLGNLVYNVSHLLDPGGSTGLLALLAALGL